MSRLQSLFKAGDYPGHCTCKICYQLPSQKDLKSNFDEQRPLYAASTVFAGLVVFASSFCVFERGHDGGGTLGLYTAPLGLSQDLRPVDLLRNL